MLKIVHLRNNRYTNKFLQYRKAWGNEIAISMTASHFHTTKDKIEELIFY